MWEEDGWSFTPEEEEVVNKVRRNFPVRMFWMLVSMSSASLLAITGYTGMIAVGWPSTIAFPFIVCLLLLIIYPVTMYVEEEKKIKILEVLVNLDGKKVPQL